MQDVRAAFIKRLNEDVLDGIHINTEQGSASSRLVDDALRKIASSAAEDIMHRVMPEFNPQGYVGIWTPGEKFDLRRVVECSCELFGCECDLNWIDVSTMEELDEIFAHGKAKHFNGDISRWDVSNVLRMNQLFEDSDFNGDISGWNVRNVREMHKMFYHSCFNGDISEWDVQNVRIMGGMFMYSQFNQDLSKWKPVSCWNFSRMFERSAFSGDVSMWPYPEKANQEMWMTQMFYMSECPRENRPAWAGGPES